MIKFKKLLFVLVAFIFVFAMTSSVSASQNIVINTDTNTTTTTTTTPNSAGGNTTLELVEDNVCTITLDEYGRFEKRLTEFNEEEKSATLTLTFTNTKTVEERYRDVEIFFVIDNSTSMLDQYNGVTRKQAVIDSANSLAEKLFESNPNVEIGIVGFSTSDQEGTINDAELRLGLSNSQEEVQNAITNLANYQDGPRTNIQAGLTVAQNGFTSEEGKDRYIVLLTDGVPNTTITGVTQTYSGEVATQTKNTIENIESSGIQIIAAMINLDGERVEPTTSKTYRELSEEIFGTVEAPTTSKYFYIPDSELENTIVNDIFDSLVVRVDNTLKNIVIKDYFPQEIIDNFDFEYVASPNIGSVSQSIDTSDNSITWNIELLSEGETASLSYKLTLKDDYDKEIIDQILPTNERVDITAENNGNELSETSDESPTVVVRYENNIVDNTIENKVINDVADNTVAKTPIPQTGTNSTGLFIAIVSIIAVIVIARMIYLRKYSDK